MMMSIKNCSLLVALSLVAVFLAGSALAGTTGKISGKVIDAKTNEALPGANVTIVGTTMGAATDADGLYFILNVPPGVYSVKVSMMGYNPVVQQKVVISVDRTTSVDFSLTQAVLEVGEEIVVTAERPLVELDVSFSQVVTTAEQAAALPANQIVETLQFEPGIELDNLDQLRIRGGGSDQISFQVDGMERMDRLNTRAYIEMNSATVSEVQILTGGFNAEYGNIRSGVFNVITKEGGGIGSGSIDYRTSPAAQKHFGPNAFGTDQYDYKLYGTSAAMNEVKDAEGNTIWQGWNARRDALNAANYMGKNDWTAQELQQLWKWRHRAWPYADRNDQYVDAGMGGPLNLEAMGLKEAGYFAGYKFTRYQPPYPILTEFYESSAYELKLNFKPAQAVKVVVNGLVGNSTTSGDGNSWQDRNWTTELYHGGLDLVGLATGRDKYNLYSQGILDTDTKQVGVKLIHTWSPSTYYEIRYNRFWSDSKMGRGRARSGRTYGIQQIGGIWFDEAPRGWVEETLEEADLTGAYRLGGGGNVRDTSSVVTQKLNLDFTSQMNPRHLVKAGVEVELNHLTRNYQRILETVMLYSEFVNYDEKPRRYAAYLQDKMEYGGMIANIGLRLDYFEANTSVYEPDDPFSSVWRRGGSAGLTLGDLDKAQSETFLRLSPRVGVSHPVGENTKFFFNYGIFYSEPPNSRRYGFYSETRPFGDVGGEVRWLSNPNLIPPKTSQYEIGFEQSVWDTYLLRATFYSKDAQDQLGSYRIIGAAGTHNHGDFFQYKRVGAGAAAYNTVRNNEYQDIRGVEIKASKLRGRFWTGWLNMDYRVSTSGNFGLQREYQDPLEANLIFSAFKQPPQAEPSFIANLDLHTPADWNWWQRDWRLSVIQRWNRGTEIIWNPENLPLREVSTKYRWVNYSNTDIRLTRNLTFGGTTLQLYMDVNNLLDQKHLNWAALSSDERERYITNVIDPVTGLGKELGAEDTWDTFTENWKDKAGTNRAPIAPTKDWALFLFPRSVLLGVKVAY